MVDPSDGVVIAEVVRDGVVESVHRASVVLLAADGSIACAAGDPHTPMLPRSALKPFQAAAMLAAGLDIDGNLLALAAASHTGGEHHAALVSRLLAKCGQPVTALRNNPAPPLDPGRASAGPSALLAPCSGKHAAMIATCVAAGWPVDGYPDPDHPLQRFVRDHVEQWAGAPITATVRDGCGAPTYQLPLLALAQMTRAMVLAAPGTPQRRVADAMRANPDVVGGPTRAITAAMSTVDGLVAKDGAEAVLILALPDGRAAALKVHDGADRAIPPALLAVLGKWSLPTADLAATITPSAASPGAAHVRPRSLSY